ncbi:MAG: hypothetical protein ACLUD2_02135 [Clostridium sp.]
MMRIGSAASTSPKVKLGDVVIHKRAVRMEGTGNHYLPFEFPAVPDFEMLKALEEAAEKLGYPYNIGVTITKRIPIIRKQSRKQSRFIMN